MSLPSCIECDSSEQKIIESFDDGDDLVDIFLKCKDCGNLWWYKCDKQELEDYE